MPLVFLRDGAACARARPAVAASSGPTSCRRGRLSREGSAYPLRRGGHALHTISLFQLSPKAGKNHSVAGISSRSVADRLCSSLLQTTSGSIIPKVFEAVGCHRGVAHGMLNVLVPEIILNGAGIMPPRRQVVAAGMAELVRMGHKGQPSDLAHARHNRAD